MKHITGQGKRTRKAYWTLFVVLLRYHRLSLLSKMFGEEYYRERIIDTHLKNAHYIKDAILDLRGLFIKVGQLLSIMTNVLPDEFKEPLEELQDQIPPRPFKDVKYRIEKELKKPISAVFAHIDSEPLAAASIGQVHRAVLKNGDSVIIKVQHKHVEQMATTDLKIIRRLIKIIGRSFNVKGVKNIYQQIEQMTEEELDFEKEAASMIVIGNNIRPIKGIKTPKLYSKFSTKRILVAEFCDGVKVSDIEQLDKWGLDKRTIAQKLLSAYCQMVFQDGFYHADPHPGNILVQEDGTIILLDFGAVATLDPKMQKGIPQLMEAAIKNDSEKIVAILSDLGFIASGVEAEEIAEKIIDAFREFLQNEVEFHGINVEELKVAPEDTSLFKVKEEVGVQGLLNTVQVPRDYFLLNRMATLLLGICNTLDEDLNPLTTVRPYLQKFVLGDKKEWVKFIAESVQNTVGSIIALPESLRKALKTVNKGKLKVKIKDLSAGAKLLYHLGQQLMFTLLTITTSVFTFIFYNNGNTEFAIYGLGVTSFCVVLLFRSFRQGKHIQESF